MPQRPVGTTAVAAVQIARNYIEKNDLPPVHQIHVCVCVLTSHGYIYEVSYHTSTWFCSTTMSYSYIVYYTLTGTEYRIRTTAAACTTRQIVVVSICIYTAFAVAIRHTSCVGVDTAAGATAVLARMQQKLRLHYKQARKVY